MRRYTEQQVRDYVNSLLKDRSQRELANEIGCLESRLSEFINDRRGLTDSLATALGFVKLPDSYVRKSK